MEVIQMKIIDLQVSNAFRKMRVHYNNQAIAEKLGISPMHVGRVLAGKTSHFEDNTWAKIEPILKPYLEQAETELPKTPNTVRNTIELRECIKDAMLRKGITSAEQLNKLIGYDSTHTIERLLQGKLNWFPDMLSATFDALGIKQDDAPLTPEERSLLMPEGIYNRGAILFRPIPVVEWANAASHLASIMLDHAPTLYKWDPETTETVAAPVGMRRGTQAFRVFGQSMEPTICDGDIIFCEPCNNIADIPEKKIVVVNFNENYKLSECAVCKRFKKAGNLILLTSDNPSGMDLQVQPDDIQWIGIVKHKTSQL